MAKARHDKTSPRQRSVRQELVDAAAAMVANLTDPREQHVDVDAIWMFAHAKAARMREEADAADRYLAGMTRRAWQEFARDARDRAGDMIDRDRIAEQPDF